MQLAATIANQVAGTRAHRELIGMLGLICDRFFEFPSSAVTPTG